MALYTRSNRRLARKSRQNFLASIIIIVILVFITINWILPGVINGIGFIRNFNQKLKPTPASVADNPSLAPPVLSIPFEATNTAQIDISGYTAADTKINLYIDDELRSTEKAGDDGSFDFSNVTLTLGTNNIYAKAVDDKNRLSLPSKTFSVIYNNQKPNLTVDLPQDNQFINGGDKKVQVSGKTDPGDEILINGNQVVVNSDGSFSTTIDLSDGDNTVDIRAFDKATNSTEIQRKVTYKAS